MRNSTEKLRVIRLTCILARILAGTLAGIPTGVLTVATDAYGDSRNTLSAPILEAVIKSDERKIRALGKLPSTDRFARDSMGRNGLILAARRGNDAVVRIFANWQLDLNARDLLGNTALHHAAESGHTRVIETLKKLGADFRPYNKRCVTPLVMAAGFGRTKAHATLFKHLAAKSPAGDAIDECGTEPHRESYADARKRWFRRMLTIRSAEDYEGVARALIQLDQDRQQARQMTTELVRLIDHPDPWDAGRYTDIAQDLRLFGAYLLSGTHTTGPAREQATASLSRLLVRGSCLEWKRRTCGKEIMKTCEQDHRIFLDAGIDGSASGDGVRSLPPWPRPAPLQLCYDCLTCSRITQSFMAAAAYFNSSLLLRKRAEFDTSAAVKRGTLTPGDRAVILRTLHKTRALSH